MEPTRVVAALGPAIGRCCYEVGPEVFEALQQAVPVRPMPIDLRRVLAVRALQAGACTTLGREMVGGRDNE